MSFLYTLKTKTGKVIKLPQVFDKVLIGNGFWPTEDGANTFWSKFKVRSYEVYGWASVLGMMFTAFCEMAYFIANLTDVLEAVDSLCTGMIGLFIALRTFHYQLKASKLKQLITLFAEEIWIDSNQYPNKVKQCHRAMLPVFVYFILTMISLTIYCVMPLFILYNTNQTMESQDKGMPYKMIFPYDAQKGFNYVVTYIVAVATGYVIVSSYYAHDALVLLFVSFLCGQFEILHGDIVRLIPESHADWQRLYGTRVSMVEIANTGYEHNVQSDPGRLEHLQNMYNKRLDELSERHRNLISFCQQLSDLISVPLLLNILNSTLLICCNGFQFLLTGTSSPKDFILFLSYFMSVTIQLFVICNCGAKVIQYSTDTANYLYQCNWEGGQISRSSPLLMRPADMEVASLSAKLPSWKTINYFPANKVFCRKLHFMIMRSQRPVELNAMKFTVLSLEGFSKILSSSMSYFALLNTFLERQM